MRWNKSIMMKDPVEHSQGARYFLKFINKLTLRRPSQVRENWWKYAVAHALDIFPGKSLSTVKSYLL